MKEKIRDALLAVGALIFLHATLSIYFWLTEMSLAAIWRPTWEIFGLVFIVIAWSLVLGKSRGADRAIHIVLTILIFLYLLLGIGQAFASREFGYDVILVLHIPFLPVLVGMMYDAEPLGMFLLYMGILIGAFLLVIGGSYASLGRLVHHCAGGHRLRVIVVAGMGGYMLILGLTLGVNPPLTKQLVHQIDLAVNFEDRINSTAQQINLETAALRRSNPFAKIEKKPNVYIFIVESYGHIMFADGGFSDFQQVIIPKMEEELEAIGFYARSHFMLVPVFGGSSWLSDASLLCGAQVNTQRRFESLASSAVRCLPDLFSEAGYHTILGAANTTVIDDIVRRMYPYDDYFYRDALGYKGPRYGWSYVPDQYTINYVHENGVLPNLDKHPIFATYMLTSSHHPWSLLPPYIEDWSKIGDGTYYRRQRAKRFRNAFVAGEQYRPGFVASIVYVIDTIRTYLKLLPDDDSLIIILGDHQPRQPVAFKDRDPWAVPIHILSRNRDLLDPLEEFGYVEGMSPQPLDDSRLGVEHFMLQLFKIFEANTQ